MKTGRLRCFMMRSSARLLAGSNSATETPIKLMEEL